MCSENMACPRFALLLASFACVTACEKVVYTRGYAMDFSDFKKIEVGKDNAQSVLEKVGSPTICSSVDDEKGGYSWFYVSKRIEKNGFLDAKVLEQRTVVVSFNVEDIVISVKESSAERHIEAVKEETETTGKGTGVANELFGGLGKYRKSYSKD